MGMEDIQVRAVKATWGENLPQIARIKVKSSGAAIAGKYFVISNSANVRYALWMNDGVATAPTVAGVTLIPVAYTLSDTVVDIATLVAAELSAIAGVFTATASSNIVSVTNSVNGICAAPRDAYSDLLKLNWEFKITQYGSEELELGCLKGDVERSFTVNTKDITCHASGSLVVQKIVTSIEQELSLEVQDTNIENIKKIMTGFGAYLELPNGAAPSEQLVIGTKGFGISQFALAQKLVLHPVNEAGKDYDTCYWKAVPSVDSIVYSGEEVLSIPIKFSFFPDSTRDGQISVDGDWSQ